MKKKLTYSNTTDRKNTDARSTVSIHTGDTKLVSNSEAWGRALRAIRDSRSNSLQRSASSPDRHARRSDTKAKLIAIVHPTLTRVVKGFSSAWLKE